jgi:acyl carrier protein
MTWTSEMVRTELIGLLRNHTQGDAPVTGESHLVADLGIDSLGVMELLADLEDKFTITIPDEALREVDTVEDVAKAIESKLKTDGRLQAS